MRAGGKHNDLDNVGYTARHHTFFEMLGNFSFGDYFKERAIELAWRLVTDEFGLSKDRLLVTVYVDDDSPSTCGRRSPACRRSASSASPAPTTSGRWATPVPAGRARKSSTTTGRTSPAARPAAPEADGDRFVEIWNLVFMQYEQLAGGERVDLPRPSIDTGMGLERIAAVLQGVHDNYDIDLFRTLIAASVEAIGVPADGRAPRQPPRHRRPPARRRAS